MKCFCYSDWIENMNPYTIYLFCVLFKDVYQISLRKSIVWEGTPHFETRVGIVPPPHLFFFYFFFYIWAFSFEKIAKIFCHRYALISLVPDSEGHNPKRNNEISRLRGYPTLWNKSGYRSPPPLFLFFYFTFELSRLRKSPTFCATAMPLSLSCQTPRVIIPSVMKSLVWEGTPHFETRAGIVPLFWLHLSFLVWKNRQHFLSCQNPKVINPSVMM